MINADMIPSELKAFRQWVRWKYVDKPGQTKPAKVPFLPAADGYAKTTDPDTWGDFATALSHVGEHGTCGVGFVLTANDPYVGVDFDHVMTDAGLDPVVGPILEDLHSYSEVSPSGTGVRVMVRGCLPETKHRTSLGNGSALEFWDRERYVTMTGEMLPGSNEDIEDGTDALARIIDRYGLASSALPEGIGGEAPPPCDVPIKSRLARARKYLARVPGAVSGEAGHTATFVTCQRIVRGFNLSEADALPLLSSWNRTCSPPWDDAELARKVREAASKGRIPWGAMLGAAPLRPPTILTPEHLASIPSDIERHKLMSAVAKAQGVPITAVKADVAKVRQSAPKAVEGWKALLIYRQLENGGERLEKLLTNAAVMLQHHEAWRGQIRWNELTRQAECSVDAPIDAPAGPWSDRHTVDATVWLQHRVGLLVPSAMVPEAVMRAAHACPYHPIRSYFNALAWDGEERLSAWLEDLAGVPRTLYSQAVARAWLISAVARTYQPGCKADHLLILEGAQGLGKSTLLSILAGDWFSDELDVMGSKDAALQTFARLIIEIAELDSLRHSDISKVKAFVSRTVDRVRLPYGRFVEEFPRGCVFAGSVNDAHYLRDETGGRRFWPVRCAAIDLEGARSTRDQLWAEAVAAYRAGEPWWLNGESLHVEAEQEQDARFQEDSWEERIAAALEPYTWKSTDPVTIANVLVAIGVDTARQDRSSQMRAAACLKRLGREVRQVMKGGQKYREWMPKGWRRGDE